MVDQTALTLYGVLRDNSGLWAELNRITDKAYPFGSGTA
jgi:hypothetical protein